MAPGPLPAGPGLLKDPGVLLKDPGVLLKDPGVLLKDSRVLLKVRTLDRFLVLGAKRGPRTLKVRTSSAEKEREGSLAGLFVAALWLGKKF